MNKFALLGGVSLILFIITITGYTDETRVELAKLTVSYYNTLSNKDYDKLNTMVDDQFNMDGKIQFNDKQKTIQFLKKVYGNKKQDIGIMKVNVYNVTKGEEGNTQLNEKNIQHYLKVAKPGDWISFISKMKVDGEVTPVKVGLIFTKKDEQWLIKGMYRN